MRHFLLPLMEGMRNEGHEVIGVCADGPKLAAIREKGFRVETVEFKRNYDILSHFKAYRRLVRLFRNERFDIVHVHTPIAALIGRLAAARVGVPKIVYTAHGFYFHENQSFWLRSIFIALEWLGGRFTDVLFTQAEEDAETAKRFGFCKDIMAIGNGVDINRFQPFNDITERQIKREALGANSDDVVILMVGRLVAEKGYLELFQAMKSVRAKLWVVGSRLESDHASSIDQAIENLKSDPALSGKISFLGYRTDVDDLMKIADIFTLPSHREGMPRSIIEGMASGLPVVATNIRGSREEVIDGKTGFLTPLGNVEALSQRLTLLVSDEKMRTTMGENGRRRAIDLYSEKNVINRQINHLKLTNETCHV